MSEREAFSVLERLLLLHGVLPEQGDITTLRLVRRLREALSFSELEHKNLAFHEAEGQPLRWDQSKAVPKDVEIGPKMRELIAAGLMRLSEAGTLSVDHLGLCDRFLAEESEEGAA